MLSALLCRKEQRGLSNSSLLQHILTAEGINAFSLETVLLFLLQTLLLTLYERPYFQLKV